MNKVILIGNLTRDVEIKTTASGKSVATCGIATSRKYKTESGEVKEDTQFHNLTVWGKPAEIFKTYLSKGKKVMVEGELRHRQWDKPDGTKGYATEVAVQQFEFLTPKDAAAPPPAAPVAAQGAQYPAMPQEEEIKVEDIPF